MKDCVICGRKKTDMDIRCKDCEEKAENYLPLIVIDPDKSNIREGDKVKNSDAFRTGEIIWMNKERAKMIFELEPNSEMVFIDPKAAEIIKSW